MKSTKVQPTAAELVQSIVDTSGVRHHCNVIDIKHRGVKLLPILVEENCLRIWKAECASTCIPFIVGAADLID